MNTEATLLMFFKHRDKKILTESYREGPSWISISEAEACQLAKIPLDDDWMYALQGEKRYLKSFRATSSSRWITYDDGSVYDRLQKRLYDRNINMKKSIGTYRYTFGHYAQTDNDYEGWILHGGEPTKVTLTFEGVWLPKDMQIILKDLYQNESDVPINDQNLD